MDIDIMGLAEGGQAAQDPPTAGPPKSPLCDTAATGAAAQPDVYDFDTEEALGTAPSARPCPAEHLSGLPNGLPNGDAAQEAQPECVGACSGALAPEQQQPLLCIAGRTDESAAQPVAQPDQAAPAADAHATIRAAKRSRSVFGGEADADGPHKAAKTLCLAAPCQAAQAHSGLNGALRKEFAASGGSLWRDVSVPPDSCSCLICGPSAHNMQGVCAPLEGDRSLCCHAATLLREHISTEIHSQ